MIIVIDWEDNTFWGELGLGSFKACQLFKGVSDRGDNFVDLVIQSNQIIFVLMNERVVNVFFCNDNHVFGGLKHSGWLLVSGERGSYCVASSYEFGYNFGYAKLESLARTQSLRTELVNSTVEGGVMVTHLMPGLLGYLSILDAYMGGLLRRNLYRAMSLGIVNVRCKDFRACFFGFVGSYQVANGECLRGGLLIDLMLQGIVDDLVQSWLAVQLVSRNKEDKRMAGNRSPRFIDGFVHCQESVGRDAYGIFMIFVFNFM